MNNEDKEKIKWLTEKIDSKYQGRILNHDLLSDIGNDFGQYYFPEIFNLTYINNLSNKSIGFITNVLVVVILMGVLVGIVIGIFMGILMRILMGIQMGF